MTTTPPKVFVSYSHDDDAHKAWVLNLANRLVLNGVDVMLDQWNLSLGSDLQRFMELGLTTADRVLAICTDPYVEKANGGTGGVGYEKMILSAQLMAEIGSDRIIPVVRRSTTRTPVPTFLLSKVYIDFQDDAVFERKYTELLRDIQGEQVVPRPALGANPFAVTSANIVPEVSFSSARYVSPATSGTVTFDFSNNDGKYVVGAGDYAFETKWSRGDNSALHVYNDPASIRTVALALDVNEIQQITNASTYDTSSRTRSPSVGEIVVWQNTAGYYLATRVEHVSSRGHGQPTDEVTFTYVIAPHKSKSFLPQ